MESGTRSGCNDCTMPKKPTFNAKTSQAYRTLLENARAAAKNKALALPYTLAGFRQWAWEQSSYPGEQRATRKKGSRTTVNEGIRWLCPYAKEEFGLDEFGVDHKIPRSRGGPDTLANLCVCRALVNKAKGSLTSWEFEQIIAPMRLWPRETREMALRQWATGTSARARLMRMGQALRARRAG